MPLPIAEAGAACALSRFSCLGPARLRALRARFGSFLVAWLAPETDLARSGIGAEAAAEVARRRKPGQAAQDAAWLEREGICTVTEEDALFPRLLGELPDPPAFLHLRGDVLADAVCVAVVGTRRATAYGMEMARDVARGLARAGVVVVSGLALGIDAAAHAAAVDAGGPTWGFLGSGLNEGSIYPPSNRPLAKRLLARGGALLSEFPPGMAGHKHIFAMRNRLIAGVSLGTVVIEAAERSGSLITAHAAVEYGREVMAVPGDARSAGTAGTHALIRKGATLVASADDVLETLGLTRVAAPAAEPLPEDQGRMLAALARGPACTDDLARAVRCPAPEAARALSLLELAGRVRQSRGGLWMRSA